MIVSWKKSVNRKKWLQATRKRNETMRARLSSLATWKCGPSLKSNSCDESCSEDGNHHHHLSTSNKEYSPSVPSAYRSDVKVEHYHLDDAQSSSRCLSRRHSSVFIIISFTHESRDGSRRYRSSHTHVVIQIAYEVVCRAFLHFWHDDKVEAVAAKRKASCIR